MVALCPLLMRSSGYQLHIQKRQGWKKVHNKKESTAFVLFSTDHDVFTEKMCSSLLFIDIISTLFTYDTFWLLTVYKLATSGQRLPLDTAYPKI